MRYLIACCIVLFLFATVALADEPNIIVTLQKIQGFNTTSCGESLYIYSTNIVNKSYSLSWHPATAYGPEYWRFVGDPNTAAVEIDKINGTIYIYRGLNVTAYKNGDNFCIYAYDPNWGKSYFIANAPDSWGFYHNLQPESMLELSCLNWYNSGITGVSGYAFVTFGEIPKPATFLSTGMNNLKDATVFCNRWLASE